MVNAAELKATRTALIREHTAALSHIDGLITFFEKREGSAPVAIVLEAKAQSNLLLLTATEEEILKTARELPPEDFTSPKIYEAMTAKNVDIGGADRDAKINTVTNYLYKLQGKDLVEVSVPGRGRRATVYALKERG